jgi:hypothetical protein
MFVALSLATSLAYQAQGLPDWIRGVPPNLKAVETSKLVSKSKASLVAVQLGHHIFDASSKFVLEAIGLPFAHGRNKNWYSKYPQEGQRIA